MVLEMVGKTIEGMDGVKIQQTKNESEHKTDFWLKS